jgi:hypothetical protein
MKRWASPGCATYGRGRAQRSTINCAIPSASSALNPAATTPCLPLTEAPLAAREEEHGEQRHEDELGVQREETEGVFEPVVTIGQVVDPVVDREIDVKTITRKPDLRGSANALPHSLPQAKERREPSPGNSFAELFSPKAPIAQPDRATPS